MGRDGSVVALQISVVAMCSSNSSSGDGGGCTGDAGMQRTVGQRE